MATKRAYKLQEFVAHASNVNCAKFGKQTSRILITGGEDQKVNLWAVGKPSSILSLSGLTSPIESVSFDASEVMIGAGAASGTIKIWDIEEAKVVRTFIGHRSKCASLDFHPFGEFFASGSSDTNMKIWDMRKKRCIHTYKGHTRRIDVLRFTPDGRWIVSGGADNSVKIWDLTAGKLLHDFRLHEGPINCLTFHPHEFLLATGSSDKTVKFCDLETFELIGSSGPENCREYFAPGSVVRSMTFNSDGKALFCGLHENLKVLSWEPIICHDVVDVGWSTLADLSVQEGKLLGCSYNQSYVGIWVVDLMKIEPYAVTNAEACLNESVNSPIQADDSISSVFGRLSVSRSPGAVSSYHFTHNIYFPLVHFSTGVKVLHPKASYNFYFYFETATNEISSNTLLKRSVSASKEIHVPASFAVAKRLSKTPSTGDHRLTRADSVPLLPPRVGLNPDPIDDQNSQPANVVALEAPRVRSKVDLSTRPRIFTHNSRASAAPTYRPRSNRSAYSSEGPSFLPAIVPTNSSKMDPGSDPNFSEVPTTNLAIVEPRNIVKSRLAMHHGKEDGFDAETGCRKISGEDMSKIIPETSSRVNLDRNFRRNTPENESKNVQQTISQSKPISSKRKIARENSNNGDICCFGPVCTESVESNEIGNWYSFSGFEKTKSDVGRNLEYVNVNRRAVSQLMESSESNTDEHRPSCANYKRRQYTPTLDGSQRRFSIAGKQSVSATDEDAIADLMENHQEFIHGLKSRLTKIEVVYRCWQNKDMKGSVDAMRRMLDHTVTADIISVLVDNTTKYFTLDICTYVLPLASNLLDSRYDRHLNIALQMILKLVKSFGATISSTLSAAPPVGVDLEAEQRLERCNSCFQELKKVDASLISLTRRQGEVGRSAQELSLFLQDILQLTSSI